MVFCISQLDWLPFILSLIPTSFFSFTPSLNLALFSGFSLRLEGKRGKEKKGKKEKIWFFILCCNFCRVCWVYCRERIKPRSIYALKRATRNHRNWEFTDIYLLWIIFLKAFDFCRKLSFFFFLRFLCWIFVKSRLFFLIEGDSRNPQKWESMDLAITVVLQVSLVVFD